MGIVKTADIAQFARYIGVGIFNSIFGFAVIFTLMYLLRLSPELSNLIGYACGIIVSYVLNRTFTFRSTEMRRIELPKFVIVFGLAYGLNFVVLWISLQCLHIAGFVSQIIAGFFYIIASYSLNKIFVFRNKRKPPSVVSGSDTVA